jgi:hypothetical protein
MSAAGQEYPYATFLNVLFPPLELVDVPSLVEARSDRWYNQTLCQAHRRPRRQRWRRPRHGGRISGGVVSPSG